MVWSGVRLERGRQPDRSTRVLPDVRRFARVVTFDKRGVGLSERSVGIADLETRMDDVRAVMDAVGLSGPT